MCNFIVCFYLQNAILYYNFGNTLLREEHRAN